MDGTEEGECVDVGWAGMSMLGLSGGGMGGGGWWRGRAGGRVGGRGRESERQMVLMRYSGCSAPRHAPEAGGQWQRQWAGPLPDSGLATCRLRWLSAPPRCGAVHDRYL